MVYNYMYPRYGQLCVDPQSFVSCIPSLLTKGPCCSHSWCAACLPWRQPSWSSLRRRSFSCWICMDWSTHPTWWCNRLGMSSEEVLAYSMSVGPSCQCLAFGDSSGVVHLWAEREEVIFNPYATQETVFRNQG